MKSPIHYRRRCKASKMKRSPKNKVAAKQEAEEEEVVWFSNPSKEAARVRREQAKDIMGRELWNTIMEDSSDDDDDEQDEEFYFYGSGWHSSPQPIKDLVEVNQPEKDSQDFVFDAGSTKDVAGVENINQRLRSTTEHSAVRVGDDQIKTVVSKDDDPNSKNHGDNDDLGSDVGENVQEAEVVVEVEISHDDDAQEIIQNVDTMTAMLEHNGLKEQRNEGDNQQGHNDDAGPDLGMAETQTANVVMKGETNDQVMTVSIESVCESNQHWGGLKYKIRCWARYVGRKIRGWFAKIHRALLSPCCIITHTAATTQSQ